MSLSSTNTQVNEYKVFKIIDVENQFYKYIISEIDDTEMNLEHFEHYCGIFQRRKMLLNILILLQLVIWSTFMKRPL